MWRVNQIRRPCIYGRYLVGSLLSYHDFWSVVSSTKFSKSWLDIFQKWNCEGIVFQVRRRFHVPRIIQTSLEPKVVAYKRSQGNPAVCRPRLSIHGPLSKTSKGRADDRITESTMILKPLILCLDPLADGPLVCELEGVESSEVVKWPQDKHGVSIRGPFSRMPQLSEKFSSGSKFLRG